MINKFSKREAKVLIPQRKANANKSDSGRALIIAGSSGMFGAAILSATAAARAGAGYVLLMTDLKKFSVTKNPDFLTVDSSKSRISELRFDSAAIGPGLGMSLRSKGLLLSLMKFPHSKVVVDADALNLCAKYKLAIPSHWIVTPHEAELARLINISSQEIKKKRKYFKVHF